MQPLIDLDELTVRIAEAILNIKRAQGISPGRALDQIVAQDLDAGRGFQRAAAAAYSYFSESEDPHGIGGRLGDAGITTSGSFPCSPDGRILNEIESYEGVRADALQAKLDAILGDEIWDRRAEQDAKHGGPLHDDTHTPSEWIGFINQYTQAAWAASTRVSLVGAPIEDYEDNLMDVVALAISAILSSRRKRGNV